MKDMGLSNNYIKSGAFYQKRDRHKRIELMKVQDLPNEVWYDIPSYEGLYQVSIFNRVKSLKKKIERKDGVELFLGERLVGVHETKDGYLMTRISKENKPNNILIHRAIAIAAIPNPQSLPEVNHKDGDKKNNNPSNLEWLFHHDNMIHAAKSQLFSKMPNGEKIWSSTLTSKEVLEIFSSTSCYTELAKKYNTTTSTICSIKKGKSWNHITGLPKNRKLVSNSPNPTERYGLNRT